MQEIISTILSEGGVTALERIALLFIVGGVVYILFLLVKQKRTDGDTTHMQAASIGELVIAVREFSASSKQSSESLTAFGDVMERLIARLDAHDAQALGIKVELEAAVKAMSETSQARQRQLNELPGQVAGKVSEVMSDELRKLPGEISAEINPALAEIASQVKALSEKIEQVVPSQIKELVTPEFEELKAKVNKLLAIMELQKQPEQTTIAAPTAEDKPNE